MSCILMLIGEVFTNHGRQVKQIEESYFLDDEK